MATARQMCGASNPTPDAIECDSPKDMRRLAHVLFLDRYRDIAWSLLAIGRDRRCQLNDCRQYRRHDRGRHDRGRHDRGRHHHGCPHRVQDQYPTLCS